MDAVPMMLIAPVVHRSASMSAATAENVSSLFHQNSDPCVIIGLLTVVYNHNNTFALIFTYNSSASPEWLLRSFRYIFDIFLPSSTYKCVGTNNTLVKKILTSVVYMDVLQFAHSVAVWLAEARISRLQVLARFHGLNRSTDAGFYIVGVTPLVS